MKYIITVDVAPRCGQLYQHEIERLKGEVRYIFIGGFGYYGEDVSPITVEYREEE